MNIYVSPAVLEMLQAKVDEDDNWFWAHSNGSSRRFGDIDQPDDGYFMFTFKDIEFVVEEETSKLIRINFHNPKDTVFNVSDIVNLLTDEEVEILA